MRVSDGPTSQDQKKLSSPDLATLIADLNIFLTEGAGFWRGAGLKFGALPTMRVVFERLDPTNGPDARNQAIEDALAAAVRELEEPTRVAASHLLGLSPKGRGAKGKTAREDLAAGSLSMHGRTFRRVKGAGKGSSPLGQLVEVVAKSLLKLDGDCARAGVGPRPSLLYVEDTEAFVMIVREALPDYQVVSADTLGKAMDALVNGGPFAMVLVDPNLTDLDDRAGLEVLEYLRDHLPETPRVVVTGSRFAGAITTNLGERYGVADILIKGDYTLPDLRSTVDRAVTRWTASGGDNGGTKGRKT